MNLTNSELDMIWLKARYINEECEALGFRKDQCGAWIRKSDYGRRESIYGWEADHTIPFSLGGSHNLINREPLHWKNNASKGNSNPNFCVVRSDGVTNVGL